MCPGTDLQTQALNAVSNGSGAGHSSGRPIKASEESIAPRANVDASEAINVAALKAGLADQEFSPPMITELGSQRLQPCQGGTNIDFDEGFIDGTEPSRTIR